MTASLIFKEAEVLLHKGACPLNSIPFAALCAQLKSVQKKSSKSHRELIQLYSPSSFRAVPSGKAGTELQSYSNARFEEVSRE